jgi:glycosyltransferase involved in cell wall biosynthesis
LQQDYRATLEDQAPKPAAAAGVPVVAVVMPTYNRWPHLRAAVDSVLDQEFPGVECIVVDDGSADGTPEKLVAAYGDRIRVLRMPANGVPAAARNLGIRQASAEFVCMLDSDDRLLPGSLAARVRLFRDDPGFDGVAWGPLIRSGDSAAELTAQAARLPTAARDFALAYLDHSFLSTNDFMVRRCHLLALPGGPYREDLTNNEDVELFLRLLARLPFRCCGECIAVLGRVDAGLHSNRVRILRQGLRLVDHLRADPAVVALLGKALDRFEFVKLVEWSNYAAKAGRAADFFRYFRRAWRLSWWQSLGSLKLWRNAVRMAVRRRRVGDPG